MNEEIRQRRRQAAWLCFQPHLPEDKLVDAIELLEQRFQLEGMSTLISYVTTVCTQFNIGKDVGKALCVQFFELMAHKSIALPRDPLPLVESKRLNAIRIQELKSAPANKDTATADSTMPPIEDIPPHSMIFICFLKQIIKDSFADHGTLIRLLLLCCKQNKKINKAVKAAIELWKKNPQSFRWVLALDEAKLAEFTHLLYLCLCEIAGPVEADRLFHKALAICEQRPEAKFFSPSQLL